MPARPTLDHHDVLPATFGDTALNSGDVHGVSVLMSDDPIGD